MLVVPPGGLCDAHAAPADLSCEDEIPQNRLFLTDVARPRYHRRRSFLLREKFEIRARLEVKVLCGCRQKGFEFENRFVRAAAFGSYAPSIVTTFRSALNPNRGAPARIASLINDGGLPSKLRWNIAAFRDVFPGAGV